jgi:hypothetical protein
MFSREFRDPKLNQYRQLVFAQVKPLLAKLKVILKSYDVGVTLAERIDFLRALKGKVQRVSFEVQRASFEGYDQSNPISLALEVKDFRATNSSAELYEVIVTLENISVGEWPNVTTGNLEMKLNFARGKFRKKQSRAIFKLKTGYPIDFSMPIDDFCKASEIEPDHLESLLNVIFNYFHSKLNRPKKNGSIK